MFYRLCAPGEPWLLLLLVPRGLLEEWNFKNEISEWVLGFLELALHPDEM